LTFRHSPSSFNLNSQPKFRHSVMRCAEIVSEESKTNNKAILFIVYYFTNL
jgi:hypothetical protein